MRSSTHQHAHFFGAFTLIEMLVCIGVVATLVSLVIPVAAGARSSARRTVCASQLGQFGVALVTYADMHKGRFPFADDSLDIPAGRAAPVDTIASELQIRPPVAVGSRRTDAVAPWRCPSDVVMAERFGASYRYELWPYMALFGPGSADQVSRMARDTTSLVLMGDGLAFHTNAKTEDDLKGPIGRNVVRGDGSVIQEK